MLKRFKSFFAPKPPVTVQDPEFGILTNEPGSSLWGGKFCHSGATIRFCVGGTKTVPDDELLRRVQNLIARLPEIERIALDFIRSQEPDARNGDFALYSINFLWETRPNFYALEFVLAGNVDGVWRVEFDGDVPTHFGRDD
jgi:hypothetical protein